MKILTEAPLFAKQRGDGGEFMRKVDKRFRVECSEFKFPPSPPLPFAARGPGVSSCVPGSVFSV